MLIDLKTDLKSLKYGKDRIYGGSSNQPYIRKDIPEGDLPLKGGPDSLLRGGILAPIRAAEDTSRITQRLFDTKSISGLLFIAKQNLLSRLSVKTQASSGVAYGGVNGPVNQGVYNPLSTISQTGVGITGTHLNLLGLDPTGIVDVVGKLSSPFSIRKYESLFEDSLFSPSARDTANNRLVQLVKYKIHNDDKTGDVIRYSGGPGSILGIGDTRIRLSHPTVKEFKQNEYATKNIFTFDQKTLGFISVENTLPTILYKNAPIHSISDFRETINQNVVSKNVSKLAFTDYNNFNRETTFKLGDPGKRGVDRSDPYNNTKNLDTSDKMNLQPLYSSDKLSDDVPQDFIKFHIAVIDNDDPTQKVWIHFRAFLNSFSDGYTSDWEAFKYVGRGENFYKYKGFDRNINLSFDVALQSGVEQEVIYDKLNYLATSLAPDYSSDGFMRGNLIKLTVGDYVVDLPGVLTSLDFKPHDSSPWEIGRKEDGSLNPDLKQLPHVIQVSNFNFKPVFNSIPSKVKTFFIPKDGTDVEENQNQSDPGYTKFINFK